jgi:hypothetical protein
MPNVEDFNFCPLGRIRHAQNQQKVRIWRGSGRKNKKYYIQSQNVYENKRNMDKMPGEMSDICGNSTSFCREIQELDGQFSLIDTFTVGFVRIFPAKISPSPGRAPSAAHIPSARESAKTRSEFELPRPHHFERLGPEAGVFVRLGSTNRRADMTQIDEMRWFGQFQSFDEQPIPDLNSEALDFRAASELFAPVRKLAPSALRNLRVTTEHHGREVPTVGAFPLFARNRFDRFPDAWLQAGRFAGKDRVRILDSSEIRRCLPQAADQAIALVQKHLGREAIIECQLFPEGCRHLRNPIGSSTFPGWSMSANRSAFSSSRTQTGEKQMKVQSNRLWCNA